MFIVFILFPNLKILIKPNYHIVITTLIHILINPLVDHLEMQHPDKYKLKETVEMQIRT